MGGIGMKLIERMFCEHFGQKNFKYRKNENIVLEKRLCLSVCDQCQNLYQQFTKQ